MAEIVCPRCGEIKDSSFDFYWTQGNRQRWCKECMKHYTKTWHRERKLQNENNKAARLDRLESASGLLEKNR
jgi:hypothetical protein